MPYAIELFESDYMVSGWSGLRSQRAAEKKLADLTTYGRDHAARNGRPLDAYRIQVFEHARDCPGGCPDELGLAPGCRDVAEHRIDPS